MKNLGNNKLFWVVLALVAILLVIGFGGNVFVDKVANRVIHKLQKDYSPSPYGPGLDPDRIDSDTIRRSTPPQKVSNLENWDDSWEKQRYE